MDGSEIQTAERGGGVSGEQLLIGNRMVQSEETGNPWTNFGISTLAVLTDCCVKTMNALIGTELRGAFGMEAPN